MAGKDDKGGKKPHKNKPTSEKYKHYTAGKPKHCLKCGPGILMATHKDRFSCGKCGYTEFSKR